MAEKTILLNKNALGGQQSFPQYNPSAKEQEVVGRIFARFREIADARDLPFNYFDGRNLIDYIDDSVRSFTTNIDERNEIEDWQARVHDPFTRNKVIAILGKVAQAIPQPEFMAENPEDIERERILSDLVDFAERIDDTDELMFYAMLEAAVKGTVIGYEGFEQETRVVKDVVSYDSADEIKVKPGKVITRKIVGFIVPLDEFYPAHVGTKKIKDMPDCAWRSIIKHSQFIKDYSKYNRAQFVQPYQPNFTGDQKVPFYQDYITTDIQEGNVEIIRYYNQVTDEFIIIANGIWLNPLMNGGNEQIMPIPFNHKTLPFWSAIYEPLGDFFYGKSLPDKLKAMQDVTDSLYNMLLDQSFLAVFPPILTSGQDGIEDDFLRPGRRISVDDPQNYRELNISTPDAFYQFILNWTKSKMEETSVDSVQSGQAGSGDRVTATEIQQAAKATISIIGLFSRFVKWGVRDRIRLRAKNILQFYRFPTLERVLGEGGTKEYKKVFNTFRINDTILTSGKHGIKVIEMFNKREEMPTKEEQKMRSSITKAKTGRKVEFIAVDPDYIRDFEFDLKLVVRPKPEQSKALDKALLLEKAKIYLEFMPELIDKQELAVQIARAFGDKPDNIIKEEVFNPQQKKAQFPGAGETGVGANLINKTKANSSSAAGLRQLTQ